MTQPLKLKQKKHLKNVGEYVFELDDMELDFYYNDSLTFTTKDKSIPLGFRSHYFWQQDTLIVYGAIKPLEAGGFLIKIVDGKGTIYNMLNFPIPIYAYGETTELTKQLEVPCHDARAIISEVPVTGAGKVIYGYIEFKSDEYYENQNKADGKESGPRRKARTNMKLYFKSEERKM